MLVTKRTRTLKTIGEAMILWGILFLFLLAASFAVAMEGGYVPRWIRIILRAILPN